MIRELSLSEYDGQNRLRAMTFPEPSWGLFLEVLRSVQERARPFAGMTAAADDGSSLLVDGSDGRFFVLYDRADRAQFQPQGIAVQPDEMVTVTCGGVATTLPRSCLLNESALLDVARDFWLGRLDVSVGWEPL